MSRWLSLPLLFFAVVGFQNCGSYKALHPAASSTSASSADGASGLRVDQALQTQALSILSARCGSCHQSSNLGGVSQILDPAHLIAVGLVTVGDANAGRLVGSIVDASMPPSGSVSAADLQTIKNWIASMNYGVSAAPPAAAAPTSPLPAGKIAKADPTLHTDAMAILNVNCAGCHQGVTAGGVADILVLNNLVSTGLIVAGDPSKGRLLGSIADGTMPKGTAARVSAGDVQKLRAWISSVTIVDVGGQTAMPTRAALASTFTGIFANVIQPKCVGCHGPLQQDSGKRYETFNLVRAGATQIRNECQSNSMPKSPYPKVTAAELAAFQAWVAGGSLNN